MTRETNTVHIQTDLGTITIAPAAIAGVAARAVLQTYGVVGMALPSLRDGLVEMLSRDHSKRGVVVHSLDDGLAVDVYVVLAYGLRLSEVANNIKENVRFAVENTVGIPVRHINVHIQAVRPVEATD
nr:Asp23/Gls24 family envelope stress response protein [Ardenticatena sp.]